MTDGFTNTNDFQIDTTDSFWASLSAAEQANVAANATFLAGQAETPFTTTTGWFGTDTSKFWGPEQRLRLGDPRRRAECEPERPAERLRARTDHAARQPAGHLNRQVAAGTQDQQRIQHIAAATPRCGIQDVVPRWMVHPFGLSERPFIR